eukprot:768412-Hanusia_phi.AAC.3
MNAKVELYFKHPFEAVSTYHQSFSPEKCFLFARSVVSVIVVKVDMGRRQTRSESRKSQLQSHNQPGARLSEGRERQTVQQDAFQGSTTAGESYKWPT